MIEVVGFGLAGACVALELQRIGHGVRVVEDGVGGSTRVAAGLVNPVTGQNFQVGQEFGEAWEVAERFYHSLSDEIYQSLPIVRLWKGEKDRAKFEKKREGLAGFVESINDEGVTWNVGGWLDCRKFLEVARARFLREGGDWGNEVRGEEAIWCTGARGLMSDEFSGVEHRSAKGEILTVRIPGWGEGRILNRSGWLIPIGGECYRVGATYDWDGLESGPTAKGREQVEVILRSFTQRRYEVIDHVAGVRPIIQRSEPVVCYEKGKGWMVNGLGSKGVVYAPRLARRFAEGY